MVTGLLDDTIVLEVGESLSASYCCKLLVDAGARVIKVEAPGSGDILRRLGPFPQDIPHPDRSGLFTYLNAGKQGITLDIQKSTGRTILHKLASTAHAVVLGFPGRLDEGLLSLFKSLEAEHPNLVLTSISPFGLSGPYSGFAAYDINIAAAAGVSVGIGDADREPLGFPIPLAGYHVGLCAASATVTALLVQDEAGFGQSIDLAEAETLGSIYTGPEALMYIFQWRWTQRTGRRSLDFPYPNCILPCKDGFVFVGAMEGRQWRTLLHLMGDPAWAKDPRFADRTAINNLYADEADAHMVEWLQNYTKADLLNMALANHLPTAPVYTIGEVADVPGLASFFVDATISDGPTIRCPGIPYELSGERPPSPRVAPSLGEHNALVYKETLGYTNEEIVGLHQCGVI